MLKTGLRVPSGETVASVSGRIEQRLAAVAAEAERRCLAAAPLKAAESAREAARMAPDAIQAQTIARSALTPVAVESLVVIKDVVKGEVKVDRHQVTALFNPSSNAVMRLWRKGQITEEGVRACGRFAWAGDRVFRGATPASRVWDGVLGAATPYSAALTPPEIDAAARDDWERARKALLRSEWIMMDRVMRFDMGSAEAARVAFKGAGKHVDKLVGMGDAALISAAQRLAVEYGYAAPEDAPLHAMKGA